MINVNEIYQNIIENKVYKNYKIVFINDRNSLDIKDDIITITHRNDPLFMILTLEFMIHRSDFKNYNIDDRFYLIYQKVFNKLKDDGFDYLDMYYSVLNNIIDSHTEFTKFFKDDVRKHKLEKIFSNK